MHQKKVSLSPQDIEKRLLGAGVQPTLQRIAICRYVLCEADHPTAEQVKDWAQQNLDKISQATVYNTLNALVDAGLLRALRLPHTEKVIYDDNIEDHHHFFDEETGRLYDLPEEQIDVRSKLPKKFKTNRVEVLFTGKVED
ncbi:MAG TPA: Fur family transcriptional regulator [Pseudobdellovibrionaceae bacterium]|nr:Fur family transcriptional regulator [Pseudobdellovibrionaceae bacterium]